jgi:hypothetical protein
MAPDANALDGGKDRRVVYWRRALPPIDAEPVAEHIVEATNGRVAGTIARRDELWDQCSREPAVGAR